MKFRSLATRFDRVEDLELQNDLKSSTHISLGSNHSISSYDELKHMSIQKICPGISVVILIIESRTRANRNVCQHVSRQVGQTINNKVLRHAAISSTDKSLNGGQETRSSG